MSSNKRILYQSNINRKVILVQKELNASSAPYLKQMIKIFKTLLSLRSWDDVRKQRVEAASSHLWRCIKRGRGGPCSSEGALSLLWSGCSLLACSCWLLLPSPFSFSSPTSLLQVCTYAIFFYSRWLEVRELEFLNSLWGLGTEEE